MELYKKYRPRKLSQIVGNEATVESLENMMKRGTLPHTTLFHGPPGCGKTTMARILTKMLGCSEMDLKELNCSNNRGIETIRSIEHRMTLGTARGSVRVWIMDEVHQLTNDAQNASLKMFEDTPEHVYFFLCTTDPAKLKKAILSRCNQIEVKAVPAKQLTAHLQFICEKESIKVESKYLEDIVEATDGMPRAALVMLDKLRHTTEANYESVIRGIDMPAATLELCRALYQKKRWATIAKLIANVEQDPESIRHQVMGYAKSILLKKADFHAYHIITCMEDHFYDSKMPGFVRACFDVIHGAENG